MKCTLRRDGILQSTSVGGASAAAGRRSGRGDGGSSVGSTSPPRARGASSWARCRAACCSRRCRPSSAGPCRTAGSRRRRWGKPRRRRRTSDNVSLHKQTNSVLNICPDGARSVTGRAKHNIISSPCCNWIAWIEDVTYKSLPFLRCCSIFLLHYAATELLAFCLLLLSHVRQRGMCCYDLYACTTEENSTLYCPPELPTLLSSDVSSSGREIDCRFYVM